MLSRNNLHKYQERAVEFVKNKKKCALFLDMGLGKSSITLTALQELKDTGEITTPILIIAPLRVANTVWHTEADKWSHINLTFSIVTGAVAKREKALASQADIHIINRENVPWLVKKFGAKWSYKTVVIDESSSFKSPKAQRFKALKKVNALIDRMVLLTGTPSPNGLLDIWTQMYLLDTGVALGRTMTRYKERFFKSDYFGYTWTINKGAEKQIHKLINPMVLSMQADDYLDMPERIDNIIEIDLPRKAMKQYQELETEYLLEISDDTITAVNAAVLAGKLLQLSSGALYTEDGVIELHDAKLDALAEVIDDTSKPILVAYNFKSDLERLQKRFPKGEVLDKNGDIIDDWNKGNVPLLFAHPQSAGHGLNLQHGSSIMVWFGLTWSLEYYQQFNARLYRQGQKDTVIIHHIIAKDTIDETVMKALDSKDITQNQLLVALKDKAKKIALAA